MFGVEGLWLLGRTGGVVDEAGLAAEGGCLLQERHQLPADDEVREVVLRRQRASQREREMQACSRRGRSSRQRIKCERWFCGRGETRPPAGSRTPPAAKRAHGWIHAAHAMQKKKHCLRQTERGSSGSPVAAKFMGSRGGVSNRLDLHVVSVAGRLVLKGHHARVVAEHIEPRRTRELHHL